MIKKALARLPLFLTLILIALATPAFAQSWTSANGEFTIEAEFMQLKGDKVQLKKESNDKVIWVELKKLSADAQKQAKRLQKEADKKSSPANKSDKAVKSNSALLKKVKVKCKAELTESKFDGEDPQVIVSVTASGPPAATAMKYGKVNVEKFADGDGKKLTPEDDRFSANDITISFAKVERDSFFGNHPKNGVVVEFKLPAEVKPKMISELSGTFSVLTGGKKSITSVSNLAEHFGKTIKNDVLKKAKIKVEVEKPSTDNDSYSLSFNVSGDLDSFNRIWIGDVKQKELEAQQGSSNSSSGKSANYTYTFKNDVSDSAILYIETVEGAIELEIPFEFSDTKVKGQ